MSNWSLVIGSWLLVIDNWSLVIAYWWMVIGNWSLVIPKGTKESNSYAKVRAL